MFIEQEHFDSLLQEKYVFKLCIELKFSAEYKWPQAKL